ncbi:type IV secretion system protein VirB5 [Bartonella callosciuri]|uniref:Type IV secretion system protein VirB5 n=1 Tax=Bartonella callosciuri TaxID=686223 RepID=A0A840NX71_9HYPH|nr:type IV secretion system protein VirB5 [Bartonella callosciuri]
MKKLTIIVAISVILAILNSKKSWSASGSIEDIQDNIFKLTEKIHNSITGNTRIQSPQLKKNDGSLYFLKPEFIYDSEKQTGMDSKIPSLVKDLMRKENYLRDKPLNEARELIDERFQYATLIDKAVTLRTFEETENRFEQIAQLLTDLDKMNDLKGIAELQVRMKGMLAMIQNEAIKLQMISYSRDTEQALITRLKRKRNVQILQFVNKKMPIIRSQ